ncbi:MAG: YraN family protein [Janthinobacterium lividum]
MIGPRPARGRAAHRLGVAAETMASDALEAAGWVIKARRHRTAAGEIDLIAEHAGLLAFIEVKARPTLAGAAWSLGPKQRARLLAAAEIVIAEHPDWGPAGMRFDVLLVDAAGSVRRIEDAFRLES